MAVYLLNKIKNLSHFQKQLDHASPATTANMYTDISFKDMQEGVDGVYDITHQS
jgi:site-specific recombinase XerC